MALQAGARRALSYEAVTVSSTAIGLTATAYRQQYQTAEKRYVDARYALITVEDADVRFTLDGTTPTSSVGHLLTSGSQLILEHPDQIAGAQFIRTASTDASLKVTYFE